jgi:hypothetical protein
MYVEAETKADIHFFLENIVNFFFHINILCMMSMSISKADHK